MKRDILESHGIYYEDDPAKSLANVVPPHFTALKGVLLDFTCTIQDRLCLDDDEDFSNISAITALSEGKNSQIEHNAMLDSIKMYRTKMTYAGMLNMGEDREAEWQRYYTDGFLIPLRDAMYPRETDSRRTSREKFYYRHFEFLERRPWVLFHKRGVLRKGKSGLTEPIPDSANYFPIYDANASARMVTSNRWPWENSCRLGLVENFTLQTLRHLAKHGLEPSVGGVFRKEKRGIALSDYMCYPWLIVEHKKHERKADECYCQAANGASAALTMMQILSKYAPNKADDGHVPPIVALTTVGAEVRIWIAYVSNGGVHHESRCIWKGDAMRAIDLVKLDAILENLHIWAMNRLRPWISTYIDQWMAQHPFLPESVRETENEERSVVYQGPDKTSDEDDPELTATLLKDLFKSERETILAEVKALLEKHIPGAPPEQPIPRTLPEQHIPGDGRFSPQLPSNLPVLSNLNHEDSPTQENAKGKRPSVPLNSPTSQAKPAPMPRPSASNTGPGKLSDDVSDLNANSVSSTTGGSLEPWRPSLLFDPRMYTDLPQQSGGLFGPQSIPSKNGQSLSKPQPPQEPQEPQDQPSLDKESTLRKPAHLLYSELSNVQKIDWLHQKLVSLKLPSTKLFPSASVDLENPVEKSCLPNRQSGSDFLEHRPTAGEERTTPPTSPSLRPPIRFPETHSEPLLRATTTCCPSTASTTPNVIDLTSIPDSPSEVVQSSSGQAHEGLPDRPSTPPALHRNAVSDPATTSQRKRATKNLAISRRTTRSMSRTPPKDRSGAMGHRVDGSTEV